MLRLGLFADGARRAPFVASATLGADLLVSTGVALFGAVSGESGDSDSRVGARAEIRLAF